MSRDSDKLDSILEKLRKLDSVESKIDNLATQFNTLTTTVNTLKTDVKSNTDDIAAIRLELGSAKEEMESYKKEVKSLKTAHNTREQRLRACTLRIFNVPCSIGESQDNFKNLATKIYDRVIRPALTAAKAAGDIGIVPQYQNAIKSCFRAFSQREPKTREAAGPSAASSSPPPVIVHLTTTTLKWAVMKHRRGVPLPPDAERDAGFRRYVVVEDLTPDSHRLLKQLQADTRTEKVWSAGGQIFFTRPGSAGAIKVKNVFDSVESILGS